MSQHIVYGEGGWMPEIPGENIIDLIEVPDHEPDPVSPDTVIGAVAAMTADQKAALRAALGL